MHRPNLVISRILGIVLAGFLLASCDSQTTEPDPRQEPDLTGDWSWQNPLPQGNGMWAVASLGASTWIATGGNSYLMRTVDDGRTWTAIDIPLQFGVRDLAFADQSIGFAMAWSGEVLRSTDGGLTWTAQSKIDDQWMGCIEAVDASTVIALGAKGIHRSTDSGATWSVPMVEGTGAVTAVSFLDETTGIAVGYRGLAMKSVDAGATWADLNTDSAAELKGIEWVSDSNIIAVGEDGAMLSSSDAGSSWRAVESGTEYDLDMVRFFDFAWGIAVGWDVVRTSNGGFNWQVVLPAGEPPFLDALDLDDQGNALAVGRFGAMAISPDRGVTWGSLSSGNRSELRAVHFASDLVGTAVGEDGTILRSEDGGHIWFDQSPDLQVTFEDVWLTGESSGVVVGHDDVVLHTRDAGASWQSADIEIFQEGLYSLFFLTNELGYAGSWTGEIYRTIDGGMSWELHSDPRGPQGPFYDLYFLDAHLGYVSDGMGRIWRTTDGGLTWYEPLFNASRRYDQEFDAIAFFDQDHGLAVGPASLMLETVDGGESWGYRSDYEVSSLMTLEVVTGTDIAYAAGSFGIYRTVDRGQTWDREPRLSYSEIFDLAILSDAVIAVGSGGTIIRRVR